MFNRLKNKWGVNTLGLILIICTFALGGSLCGYVGRKILVQLFEEKNALWYVCYILLITLLWPLCVLVISIPMGQFPFFKNYIQRIFRKIGGKK